MGTEDPSMSEEAADEAQYCTGCKEVKPRASFDGSSVCSECLCKRLKRKKHPGQASNSKRQVLTIKEENVHLRELLSQLSSENAVLQQRVCLDSRAVLESEQQLAHLRELLSSQMAGRSGGLPLMPAMPSGPAGGAQMMALAAALRHQQARPQAGGVPFMQHPQSTLSRPLHMPSDLQAADRMAQMMASVPRLMMHGPQGVAAYENAKGSGNGKGQRAAAMAKESGIMEKETALWICQTTAK